MATQQQQHAQSQREAGANPWLHMSAANGTHSNTMLESARQRDLSGNPWPQLSVGSVI